MHSILELSSYVPSSPFESVSLLVIKEVSHVTTFWCKQKRNQNTVQEDMTKQISIHPLRFTSEEVFN